MKKIFLVFVILLTGMLILLQIRPTQSGCGYTKTINYQIIVTDAICRDYNYGWPINIGRLDSDYSEEGNSRQLLLESPVVIIFGASLNLAVIASPITIWRAAKKKP